MSSWTLQVAVEARGEVRRREKVVEGVGRWAEDRPEYQHSEEPGRKAKKEW